MDKMQAVFRFIPVLPLLCLPFWAGVAVAQVTDVLRPQARPAPVEKSLDAIRPQARPSAIGRALAAAQQGEWSAAQGFVARENAVAQDLIGWLRLRAGQGSFREGQAFLRRRSDWPGLDLIRRRAEPEVLKQPRATVLEVFDAHPPETIDGILAYADALSATDRREEAQSLIVTSWLNRDMETAEQAALLEVHEAMLKEHHDARLDAMLWQNAPNNARRMFTLVSDDQRALAQARIALRRRASNANALLDKVPDKLKDTPGLAHARFEWRVRAGNWDDAKALLLERSVSAGKLGNPQAWSNRRRVLARDELRDGAATKAYQLAARHHLTGGSAYADLEWLSGYIALTRLNDPETALAHFENHDRVVQSPISQGRAGYWKGRAHRAMDNAAEADMEFAKGAAYQTSFYGLLAAEAAGLPFDVGLADVPTADWRDSPVARDSLFQAGRMLAANGRRSQAERFWRQLADQLDADDAALLGQAAIDLGEPHLAVMIGKTVALRGVTIPKPYYALHPLADQDLPVPRELSLAIARRESEFDPVVKSGAGALGLMQLMPATAREVAGGLGLRAQHSTARLTADPVYNAKLGSQYLAELAAQFDGNIVMMAAGYNAGPSRPTRWMTEYGDPRKGNADAMIDWIEGIPFRETRNYVMRVSESLPIYRARLGLDPLPLPFSQELRGATLKPTTP